MAVPTPPVTMLTFAPLERRADTVLFRSCFVPSIWHARFLCRTGRVTVNGKKISVPGYVMEDGDILQVMGDKVPLLNPDARYEYHKALRDEQKDETNNEVQDETEAKDETDTMKADGKEKKVGNRMFPSKVWQFEPIPYMAPFTFLPEYLEVNYNNLTVCFLRSPVVKPGRCEIPSPFDDVVHQRTYDHYVRHIRQ